MDIGGAGLVMPRLGRAKMDHDDKVRVIAYRLWEQEGRPDGRALDHWPKAEALWDDEQQFEEHLAKDVEGCALCT
jgi:hypothetical protein